MANVLDARTIRIDTTMASGFQETLNPAIRVPVRLLGAKLIGGTAASTASITDAVSGNVIASFQCANGATDSLILVAPLYVSDFKVTIAGTGAVLEIYRS